jgi:hypothetical protein
MSFVPNFSFHAGLNAFVDAERGHGRGVARAAARDGDAGHVLGLAGDPLHVLDGSSYVFGGYVAAAQRPHEAAERTEEGLRLQLLRVAHDHGLAAAEVEAGDRRFITHSARKS